MSSPSPPSESMIEQTIKTAETIIQKWNIDDRTCAGFISIFHENNKEAAVFINCVRRLHRAMRYLASNNLKSDELTFAQRLMQIAMKRLQTEFHLILLDNHEYLDPELVAPWSFRIDSESPRMPLSVVKQPFAVAISNLRLIADVMIRCGYGRECIGSYTIIRKSTIDEALFHLGIHPYSRSHVKTMTNAPDFDNHVKIWLKAVEIAVKTLFYGEKFLCDRVFGSYEPIRDLCFEKSTKEGAINLFTFPELIATRCKKLKSDTIFVMIDLYNSISDLWPEIDSIFSNERVSSVKIQALSSLRKLSDAVRTFGVKLELYIQRNSSKFTIAGGGIHPLNNSVMTYLSSLSDYGDDLQCKEPSLFVKSYVDCVNTSENSPSVVSVSVAFARVIRVLLCKMDVKSRFHNYAALSYLFLANNLHFVIEKVRVTNMKFILGDEWIIEHGMKLKHYVSSYQSTSWNRVVLCLPEDTIMTPEKVRDCFRRMYSTFEEVYGKHRSWIVVEEKMREEMKASIAKKLVPVYQDFYVTHLTTLCDDKRCVKMLARLSPENMAKYLSELFPGTSAVLRSSWSFHSSSTLPAVSQDSWPSSPAIKGDLIFEHYPSSRIGLYDSYSPLFMQQLQPLITSFNLFSYTTTRVV